MVSVTLGEDRHLFLSQQLIARVCGVGVGQVKLALAEANGRIGGGVTPGTTRRRRKLTWEHVSYLVSEERLVEW